MKCLYPMVCVGDEVVCTWWCVLVMKCMCLMVCVGDEVSVPDGVCVGNEVFVLGVGID